MAPKKKYIITKKSGKLDLKLQSSLDKKLKTHKFNKYYPAIINPTFTKKISSHGIFKKYKLTINKKRLEKLYNAFETNTLMPEDIKRTEGNIYILKPFQKMLRNFMGPSTPYRSILIYHEMGVGKTCTAITIAESLKNIAQNSGTKIYVIRPDEIVRQIFDINVVSEGRPKYQCTGDTYLQNPKYKDLVKNCIDKNEESCNQLKSKVEKEIRNYYEFSGAQSWARNTYREIETKIRNIENPVAKLEKKKAIIRKMFDNAVLIVDEAHELRDSNEKDAKIVTPILNDVLRYSNNLRVIFLSATPIYDKPQNIISLINYFLLNDKRPLMKESDVFTQEGNLKPTGEAILEQNMRGYISFLRGSNPFDFPIRVSAKYNIPNNILNLSKYPKKDINNRRLDKNQKIKYLELVDCPVKSHQRDILNYHVKYDKIPELNVDDMDNISNSSLDSGSRYSDIDLEKLSDDEKISEYLSGSILLEPGEKSITSSKSSAQQSTLKKTITDDDFREQTVAYQFERQISNFVYLSLEECNKNIKLAIGELGLEQVAKKIPGKYTYKFNEPKYADRFKLPELYNWGSKIAKAVELAMKSNGPVFIYTYFNKSGVIPLAFALEMNGFKRYKQHETPLLETPDKDPAYRGDYIILTSDVAMSAYASEYLDKGKKMIYEKSVKVFIGTSKASEGLNLFGYREVYVIDPWHNINLTEQSIGRVIRTGSHLHLPPQERNVSVYQMATTLNDRESFDLQIYRMCEDKAIKAGVVEKIMKETAFDCELNRDANVYDVETYNRLIPLKTSHNKAIKVSLADVSYSRSCFYMKDCNFKCNSGDGSQDGSPDAENNYNIQYEDIPIQRFNFDKEIDEYKNLIINLMATSPNLKIDNLRQYLKKLIYGEANDTTEVIKSAKYKIVKKTKKSQDIVHKDSKTSANGSEKDDWVDEDAFIRAIHDIINYDEPITIKGKQGKYVTGRIALSGEYLRFIPDGNLIPNMSIQRQLSKPQITKTEIDLKAYIVKMDEEQRRLVEKQEINYDEILDKVIKKVEQVYYSVYQKEFRYNVKIKYEEAVDIVFSKLVYQYKLAILKHILEKIIKDIKLNENEVKLEQTIKQHIVIMRDVFPNIKEESEMRKNIYGFIIQNENNLELFILNSDNQFEKNQGNLKKVIEHRKIKLLKTPNNKLYGYLKYEKGIDIPVFKITDIQAKGDKKSVRGITCPTKNTNDIKKNLNKLDDKVLKNKSVITNKNALCNDIEILMKRYDSKTLDNKKWYYTPEEYYIYFGSQG